MPSRAFQIAATVLIAAVAVPPVLRGDVARDVDYETQIKPILTAHCYQCHGGEKQKSGLRLDTAAAALRGGDSGPAVKPTDSKASLIIQLVRGEHDLIEQMPPKGDKLSAQQIALLAGWIDQGAKHPKDETPGAIAGAGHWAFQPIERPAVPAVKRTDWPRNDIDAFILARLEAADIDPSPQADRHTLLRRLHLDLTGLPPTPGDVERFINDNNPDAYERQADRLLASPHFGERWGKHWLDLARYADSDGYEMDFARPNAWRWRAWVIDAFNEDMPFDQFTLEQIAGDLLPDAMYEQKLATGFHRNTLTNTENGIDKEEFRNKAVVDRINTVATVWLGLTLGCAECHSHKYDPISQREYYGLFAFFNDRVEESQIAAPPLPREKQAFEEAKREHERRLAELEKELGGAAGEQRKKLMEKIKDHKKDAPKLAAVAQVMAKRDSPRVTHVHRRGNFMDKGEAVEPGAPAVLIPLTPRGDDDAAPDRLDLARWLIDPANPLTARVEANRIWQHLFAPGRGLVVTTEDFGTRGEPPSHPKLLDWLAGELVAKKWSRKQMIRLIVTSATYRQSSDQRPELRRRDPHNRLLARQNRYRLEAELVRDQFLAASGLLNRQVGGPSFRTPLPDGLDKIGFRLKWRADEGDELLRRGVYIWFQRNLKNPMLMQFDHPDAQATCTRRERSNTPLQALTLMNDALFVDAARALAKRVLVEESASPARRVDAMMLRCLARTPSDAERNVLLNLYSKLCDEYRAHDDAAAALVGDSSPPDAPIHEAAAWVAVARTIMNLDEFVTRE